MSALSLVGCTLESVRPSPSFLFHDLHKSVQSTEEFVCLHMHRAGARMHAACDTASQTSPASQSSFETLPVEVVNHILSYLVLPRSRLPGLTEAQSSLDFSPLARSTLKRNEDLTTPTDSNRWAANLFQNHTNQHPFHVLSLTSRRCNELVESYCGHLVRTCNVFNLPFAQLDQYGPQSVWPDMSGIVYRRLWLQHAPRHCIYCHAVMDMYPFPVLKRLLSNCKDCFYAQTLVRSNFCHFTHHVHSLTNAESRRNRTAVPLNTSNCTCLATNQRHPALSLVLARRCRIGRVAALWHPGLS
jgi:hypothetical protein